MLDHSLSFTRTTTNSGYIRLIYRYYWRVVDKAFPGRSPVSARDLATNFSQRDDAYGQSHAACQACHASEYVLLPCDTETYTDVRTGGIQNLPIQKYATQVDFQDRA
ncbi:hypothetical protein R6Q59_010158 [Mikania micrantha]